MAEESKEAKKTERLTILATSDLHGKLFPWNYVFKEEDKNGSVFQLASMIRENYEPEHTVLLDGGDTVQDCFAEIFIPDEIHPMMKALNEIGYDVWTTGNHEYDFGIENTEHLIREFKGHAIVSNLFRSDGTRVTEPYAILERQGIRIAVLCMVTPCITHWAERALENYIVTNPIDETRNLLKELEGKYDVLIGLHHMGYPDENGVTGSGIESYLTHFPEFDAVIACHEHILEEGREINGVLSAENSGHAKTMIRLDLELEQTDAGWKTVQRTIKVIKSEAYEPDAAMMQEFEVYDQRLKEYTSRVIGRMIGEAPFLKGTQMGLPETLCEPTALISLYNAMYRHYAKTDVSCACLPSRKINLFPGPVTVSGIAGLYPFPNKLFKIRMSGKQLRKFMEFSAGVFNTFRKGDLTLSIKPNIWVFHFEIFSGVHYEIDVSKAPGQRIQNLTWPDGTPVRDDDRFLMALTSFRYGNSCRTYGPVFTEEEGLPELIEEDVCSELGGCQNMILDYMKQVLHGELVSRVEKNWKIIGCDWDEELHERAVMLAREGIVDSDFGRRALTKEDLEHAGDC